MSTELHLLVLAGLDLAGGSSLRPFLPIIAEHFGANAIQIGFLASLYAIIQIVSGPIIGRLSDGTGRKRLLQLSFIASAMTPLIILLILAVPQIPLKLYCLYAAIIPMAIFRHSQSCIKSILIDHDDTQHKSNTFEAMARCSCACYIGSTVGPLFISAILAHEQQTYDLHSVCIICAVYYLSALLICSVFLRDTNSAHKRVKLKSAAFSLDSLLSIKQQFANKAIADLIVYHFVAYLALHLYRAGFILILKHKFELQLSFLAKILSYRGIIGFAMQLYLSVMVSKATTNHEVLLRHSTLCLAVAMVLYGVTTPNTYYLLFVILIVQECGESLFRTSFQSVFANRLSSVDETRHTQTYIGLIDSFSSFNRSVAPIIFASVPETLRYSYVPVFCGCLYFLLFWFKTPKMHKQL